MVLRFLQDCRRQRQDPRLLLCPAVPTQQAVGPRAGVLLGCIGCSDRGTVSSVLAPTLAPFPQRRLWGQAPLQGSRSPCRDPARGLHASQGGEERDRREPPPPGATACISLARTGHMTPHPTSRLVFHLPDPRRRTMKWDLLSMKDCLCLLRFS